jgi:hypothetical protein
MKQHLMALIHSTLDFRPNAQRPSDPATWRLVISNNRHEVVCWIHPVLTRTGHPNLAPVSVRVLLASRSSAL